MFNQKLIGMLAKSFDLEVFMMGRNRNSDRTSQLCVEYGWAAKLISFRGSDDLLVSVVKSDKWIKGILVISKSDRSFEVPNYDALNLQDWTDPVFSTLSSIDIISHGAMTSVGQFFNVHLSVETQSTSCHFSFGGHVVLNNQSVSSAVTALMTTVFHLVDLYDKEEFHDFVQHRRET